jgi:hypothetical protein
MREDSPRKTWELSEKEKEIVVARAHAVGFKKAVSTLNVQRQTVFCLES